MGAVSPLYPDQAATAPEDAAAPENYVPEGFEDVDEFLADMRETYRADAEADRDNRDAALDDKKFWAGDQWDALVKKYREKLPCVTINTLPQFTGQLTGDWRVNRAAIKVLPNEDGDVDIASIRSDLIRNIEVQSRSDRATDNAFESMIICGDGAYRVDLDYAREDVFDQEIVIRPIDDALAVVWDRMSIDPTGRDAMHCFVDDMMPRKAFEKRWPDESPSNLNAELSAQLSADGWRDATQDTVRVTEYWRIIERERLLAMYENGSVQDITDKSEQELAAYGPPVRTRRSPCRYAQMHLVTGHAILDGPYEYKLTRLPVIRMSGRIVNIAGKRERFGLVRFMKDPVRLKNFWRSKAAEYLGYATKAKWIGPESAFEGRQEKWRNSHLNDDPLLVYNDDASAKPESVNPPQLPAALLNEAALNSQDMKDVSGLHDASLGMRSNETSGVAIAARQREGDIASVVYYDNGNAAVMEGGDVINQLIGQFYEGARTIRIVGEDQTPRLVRINDPMDPKAVDLSKGRYDVTITTGASYTTRRVEAAQAMEKFFQASPELWKVMGDLYMKMLDVPGADEFAERIRKAMPPELLAEDGEEGENPIPPQLQAQMQELMAALQAMQAENEQLKDEGAREDRKLDIDAYGKETDRIKAVTAKDFPLAPEGAAELQAVVAQAVRDVLASPDVLAMAPQGFAPMGQMPGGPEMRPEMAAPPIVEAPQMADPSAMEAPEDPARFFIG